MSTVLVSEFSKELAAKVSLDVPEAHFPASLSQSPSFATSPALCDDCLVVAGAALTEANLAAYERFGFLVLKALLSPEGIAAARAEISSIVHSWPDGAPDSCFDKAEAPNTPLVDFDPQFIHDNTLNQLADLELGVRRLFRMAIHNDFFRELVCRDALVAPIRTIFRSENVKLLQSMALLKPPGTGEKRWHQDQGYFRLTPNDVAALWIALDPTDTENGCMHVVPGTHIGGTDIHSNPVDGTHQYYSLQTPPSAENVFAVPLEAGDALLFHGDLHHGTPPNNTDRRRRALQFHYASSDCRPVDCSHAGREGEAVVVEPSPNAVFKGYNSHNGDGDGDSNEIKTASDGDGDNNDDGEAPSGSSGDSNDSNGRKTANPSPGVFDCCESTATTCTEPQHWYYRRAEMLVSGIDRDAPFV